MIDPRNVLIGAVLSLSTCTAVWLMQTPGSSSVVPAQVVAQEFRVSPVETARLAALMVTPGQRVSGGQVIARLDTSVLEREIAVAEARLRLLGSETEASGAALDTEGYHNERSFQIDVEEAASELDSARAVHAQQVAELRQVREELSRQAQYVKEGLIRRDRVDELELRENSLKSAIDEAPQRIEALQTRVSEARMRLAGWRSKYSPQSAPSSKAVRVRPVKQRAAEQVEELRVLKARLAAATIVAPADGQVVSVLAEPGDVVRAGDHFVILNGSGARQVVAYVSERDGRVLQTGQNARLYRRTMSHEQYTSRVIRVADTVSALPARFWISPQLALYGREVVLELPGEAPLAPGEALDVAFVSGGRS